ncbi:alpha-glucan family phosphorylase [Mesoterricola silvestris]|uniref:Alpha-1,4 glucan phosphorylase n=1 Tax=Mesoterricola silvestris TaxID=2927979 RepID=A0AA48K7L0_9BACT|nr:alpha-glucan family phosphorylase [Mesoterricola silvestris]BDU71989.1 alpha-1,4 glucan phosphorylase [Mesoterricola silvestris]
MASKLPQVAYFCMEYALDSTFKIYSGGLGILAGDYFKGVKDHGFPMVGIGIRWKQGYGEQHVDPATGKVFDAYRTGDHGFLEDTGVTVKVEIKGRPVHIKVWKVASFGVDSLYLLDTDLEANDGEARWITGQLYGWFGEERVAQEMVLGIGGVRALQALKIKPDVYHFNEGHALFAGFELIRRRMARGATFQDALARTREEVVFTTHTPIVQGNESHPIERFMYLGANLGLTRAQLKQLGGSPFNMTVGALRMSRIANAVAELHRVTANGMWKGVKGRCEIIGITNAIHHGTWVDPKMLDLAAKGRKDALWTRHMENKRKLIDFVEARNGVKLDPDALLIGFSRRAAPYKRSNFIFTDRSFIEPLLRSGKVQIVFSGKAHPLDDNGKVIVEDILEMTRLYPGRVVFLENYDMEIGALLTRGSDVWLNNPRRPKEASGTSGMKAAQNGVLNLSILDGWWPEACDHGRNGWQFGDGFESPRDAVLDKHDFKAFRKVLAEEVLPTYYQDRPRWVDMMVRSIQDTREAFGVKRMLDEYYARMYKRS